MNRGINLSSITILLIIFVCSNSYAQKRRYKRPPRGEHKITHYHGGAVNDLRGATKSVFFGVSINAMNYFGDIAPAPKKLSTDIGFTRSGFGLVVGRKFHAHTAIRAGFNIGKITGDDFDTADPAEGTSLGRYQRNLHFENTIKELSLGFEFDLFPNRGGVNSRFPINPYIFVGLAVFSHDPKAVVPDTDLQGNPFPNAGKTVSLRDLGTEGQTLGIDSFPKKYGKIQLAIPIGFGVKFRLIDNFDAHIEFGLRQLFFDYIDDVGGRYPDLGQFDNELTRALTDRGSEPTSTLSDKTRDTNFYNVSTVQASDGVTYNRGPNYQPDGIRGGSKDNDFYLVTSLRFIYYPKSKKVRRGKFR